MRQTFAKKPPPKPAASTTNDDFDQDDGRPGQGRGRLRSLLKDFYGIQEQTATVSVDDANIDGNSFSSTKYLEEYLRTHTFTQVRGEDKKLKTEIRQLDGEMKQLVYENFEKFIGAAETIRSMQSHVDNMEQQMSKVNDDMKKISGLSDKINSTLSSRRTKIDQLSTMHRLLKKLQFLVELPSRLNRCLEFEAYGQAVNYYKKTSDILKRYSNLPSFQSIEKECEKIIAKVQEKLKKSIADPKKTPVEISDYVLLLVDLGQTPASLRNDYLNARKAFLKNNLDVFTRTDENLVLEDSLNELNKIFLEDFVSSCTVFKSVFVDREETAAARKTANKQLEDWGKSIFSKYLSLVRTILASKETSEIITSLELVHSTLLKVHERIPYMNINEKAAEIINNTAQDQIENAFNDLQDNVREMVQVMMDESANVKGSLLNLCRMTTSQIVVDFKNVLNDLKLFFISTEASEHWPIFMTKIHVKVEQFFLFINVFVLEFYSDDPATIKEEMREFSRRCMLLLSRLCLFLESEALPQVDQSLATLRMLINDQTTDYSVIMDVQDLRLRLKNSAETLLSHYVNVSSQKISHMIWKSIDTPNWMKMKEAKGPRSAVDLVLDELKGIVKDVTDVFDTEAEKSLSAQKPKRVSSSDRFLPKKINFNEVELNKNSILTEMIKISLKSLLEFVRLQTIGKLGFQQLQIDVYYMKQILIAYSPISRGVINSLLDDVINSATERCVECVPLDEKVIATFIESRIEKKLKASDEKSPILSPMKNSSFSDSEQLSP